MYGGNLSPKVETVSLGANVQDGKIPEGLTAVAIEAKRAREHGFADAELDRAKKWILASYERAFNERDKTESSSYAQEYLDNFLDQEPSPGIAYEYRLLQQVLPGIAATEVSGLAANLFADDSRVVLITAPQKPESTSSTTRSRSASTSGATVRRRQFPASTSSPYLLRTVNLDR